MSAGTPDLCPACSVAGNLAGAVPHCPGGGCRWVRCICGAVVDQLGHWIAPPPPRAAT